MSLSVNQTKSLNQEGFLRMQLLEALTSVWSKLGCSQTQVGITDVTLLVSQSVVVLLAQDVEILQLFLLLVAVCQDSTLVHLILSYSSGTIHCVQVSAVPMHHIYERYALMKSNHQGMSEVLLLLVTVVSTTCAGVIFSVNWWWAVSCRYVRILWSVCPLISWRVLMVVVHRVESWCFWLWRPGRVIFILAFCYFLSLLTSQCDWLN